MTPLPVFALAKLGHQYLLYGVAGAVCLVVFATLILSPALSAYGRVWEKAAAGFLSLFVLAALIGLARVYLDVHFLSDVTAGWALGAAAFSLCAAVGLVVSQVRQNPDQ